MRKALFLLSAVLLIAIYSPDLAYAAGSLSDGLGTSQQTIGGDVWEFGETLNGLSFKSELKKIVWSIYTASHSALLIMTAVAGFMVVFGQENGQKLIFSYILGVGLALNFAGFMFDLYSEFLVQSSTATMPDLPTELQKLNGKSEDYLSKFMSYYIAVVTYGQSRIIPVAMRMALIFGTLQASWKMATEIGSGNQIKYVVTEVMKMSFILFLIMNWVQLGHAMGEWFEAIGFMAGGIDPSLPNNPDIHPDSIWNNALRYSGKMWTNVLDVKGIANTVAAFMVFVVLIIILFLTAIEVFMARIEFYTLTMLGTILLPFFLIDKLNFLGTNTINGMFKISAKVMVISFLQAVTFTILNAQLQEFYDGALGAKKFNLNTYIELIVTCLVMYVLIKQIPQLVSSFLSGGGGGGLSGGAMIGQAAAMAGAGMKAVGTAGAATANGVGSAISSFSNNTGAAKAFSGAMSKMGGTGAIAQGLAKGAGALVGGVGTMANTMAKAAVGETIGKSKPMQKLMEGVRLGLGDDKGGVKEHSMTDAILGNYGEKKTFKSLNPVDSSISLAKKGWDKVTKPPKK